MTDLTPPWPTTTPDADTLIRYCIGEGLAASARSLGLIGREIASGEREDRLAGMVNALRMIDSYNMVRLLQRLQDLDPVAADEVAADLWLAAEAGDSYGEWLWQWADEAGMDADGITAEAQAALTPREA